MSKVDAQRAMREARYAAQQSQVSSSGRRSDRSAPASDTTTDIGTATATPGANVSAARRARNAPDAPSAAPDAAVEETAEVEAVCGHRNMSNKRCQRPAGHSEKNHRYS